MKDPGENDAQQDPGGQESSDDIGSLFASASETESVMTDGAMLSQRAVGERLPLERGFLGREAGVRTDDMKVLWSLEEACSEAPPGSQRLANILASATILHEENHLATAIEADQDWLSNYYELPDEDDDGACTHPWVLRLEFGATQLQATGVQVWNVSRSILTKTRRQLHIIYSDLPVTAPSQVIRIRTRKMAHVQDVRVFLLRFLLHIVDLPLPHCVPTECSSAKKLKTSSQDEYGLDEMRMHLPSMVAVDILNELLVNLDALGQQRRGHLSRQDQTAQLTSFRKRAAECLAEDSKVPQGCALAPSTARESVLSKALAADDFDGLNNACGATLLRWAKGLVQQWRELPAEEQCHRQSVAQVAKEEWVRVYVRSGLEELIWVVDRFLEKN